MRASEHVSEQILIDGSAGEGGGQIVRTAAAISAVTGRPLCVENVRGKRSRPGLRPQHVSALHALAQLCQADTKGVEPDSKEFSFEPTQELSAVDLEIDVQTAGSTTLILQALLVPLSLAGGESRVVLKGGTHNPLAPTFDYLHRVFHPVLVSHGFDFDLNLNRAGFYPRGRGELEATIRPLRNPRPFQLDAVSSLNQATAVIYVSDLNGDLGHRAEREVANHGSVPDNLKIVHVNWRSKDPGFAFLLVAGGELNLGGFSAVGEEGLSVEEVVGKALDFFDEYAEMDAPVDSFLADQLVLPAAFLPGKSLFRTTRSTQHLRTVLALLNRWMYRETGLLQEPFGTWRVEVAGTEVTDS